MDPGELNKRIRLIRAVRTGRDGAGAPIVEPVELATVWAKVTYPGGREFLANEGEQTERRVVFRVYARADIDTSTVIEFGGASHDIQDIRPFDDITEIHAVVKAPVAP